MRVTANMTLHAHPPVPTVSAWVARFAAVIKTPGMVLDLACGAGRHARYLAETGLQVEALDRNAAALSTLTGLPRVAVRCADVEGGPWPYAGREFDAIVVTNYLHRPLFPLISSALAPGGVLIYETFRIGNESYGKPSNPDFLLRSGELLDLAKTNGLEVLAYEDGFTTTPKPAMVQRLCAVKPPFLPPERVCLE